MKRGGLFCWLLTMGIATLLAPTARAQYEETVARAKTAIVLIINETSQRTVGGTGFFFDSNGYIATSRYAIEDANRLTVLMADGRRLPAWVVHHRDDFAAAVIKVPGSDFPTLPMGDSDSVHRGQEVLVLGNLFSGSALRQSLPQVSVTRGIYDLQILTDSLLDLGNSGGPVLNDRGEVIGIIVSRLDLAQEEQSKWNLKVDINQFRAFVANLGPDAIAPPRTAPKLMKPQPQTPNSFIDPTHGMVWFCDHPPQCTSWSLDLTLAPFIQAYGLARVTSASVTGYKDYCWEDRQPSWCATVAVGSSRLVAITVSGGSFQIIFNRGQAALALQIGGDPESKVLAAMGNSELLWRRPDIETHWLVYDAQGLAIVIDNRRGIVTGVRVFHPGTARTFMAIP